MSQGGIVLEVDHQTTGLHVQVPAATVHKQMIAEPHNPVVSSVDLAGARVAQQHSIK